MIRRRPAPPALPHEGPAVVTGASTGIGAALARLLAERGHDLLLVAPPDEPLDRTAAELSARHAVRVQVRQLDLVEREQRRAFAADLAGRDVAVLCNNAGVGGFGAFADLDPLRQIELNVVTVAELTAAVLPGMLRRGRGAVLMVGSTAGNQAVPGAATYGACKAFVSSLGEALHTELAGSGVRCTVLVPGPVRTQFAARAGVEAAAARIPRAAWVSAEQAAAAGLAGLERGSRRVAPGLSGRVFDLGGRLAPRALLLPAVHRLIRRYT